MSSYTTIVIRMPEDQASRDKIAEGLKILQPYQTAMSIEDEMTVLELIEQHPEFPAYIAEEAREETAKLHAAAEAATAY